MPRLQTYSLYTYDPNKGAPVFFAVAFSVSGIIHLHQLVQLRSLKITALYPFTCALFAAGFAAREYGAFHVEDLDVYIASTILIYFAPPIVELANYHILGRVLYYVPYCSPLHPGRTLTTFGALSAVVEILNALGVSWLAELQSPESLRKTGQTLLRASLIVQLVVITFFIAVTATFERRCSKRRVHNSAIRNTCITMYCSAALILVRCIYRTIEYFEIPISGTSIPTVARHEWFFYVFEATVLLVNSFLWNWRHPRYYLPENHRIYLAEDAKTELLGRGFDDDRSFLITLVDPFGCLNRSRGHETNAQPLRTDGINSTWSEQC